MGQQQLLLLVLGIVIVGLAVIGGIEAFQQGQSGSTEDAIKIELFALGSQMKSFYLKPRELRGGGGKMTDPEIDRFLRQHGSNVSNQIIRNPRSPYFSTVVVEGVKDCGAMIYVESDLDGNLYASSWLVVPFGTEPITVGSELEASDTYHALC